MNRDFSTGEILLIIAACAGGALLGYFAGVFVGDLFDRSSPHYKVPGNLLSGHKYSILGAMLGTSVGALVGVFGTARVLWKRKPK